MRSPENQSRTYLWKGKTLDYKERKQPHNRCDSGGRVKTKRTWKRCPAQQACGRLRDCEPSALDGGPPPPTLVELSAAPPPALPGSALPAPLSLPFHLAKFYSSSSPNPNLFPPRNLPTFAPCTSPSVTPLAFVISPPAPPQESMFP